MTYWTRSPLIGPPRATLAPATGYLVARKVDPALAGAIARYYYERAPLAGLDATLVLAQSVLETTDPATGVPFTSWWSSRPRCNMAGIGVTGAVLPRRNPVPAGWQDRGDGTIHQGWAFGDYDRGVWAHIVHLAAYVYPAGQEPAGIRPHMTAEVDPRLPALTAGGGRGRAGVLADLAGTWAADTGYDVKIAKIASAILAVEGAGVPVAKNVQEIVELIPADNGNRAGRKLWGNKAGSITIHNTDNPRLGAGAAMHMRYCCGANEGGGASYHAVVDDKAVYQLLPYDEVSWHAGDGTNGPGNNDSLSIEICENVDSDFPTACRKAAGWVADRLVELGLPLTPGVTVVKHGHWCAGPTASPNCHSGCPARLNSGDKGVTWALFLEMVRNRLPGGPYAPDRPAPPPPPPPAPAPHAYVTIPETGRRLGGNFRLYWDDQPDRMARFGYPVTDELQEAGLTVQYFERARFEWHPGAFPDRHDVTLGRVGAELAQARGL